MTSISEGRGIVTLINVFTVAPENQQRLVDTLVRATDDVISGQPGHVSANIHKSLDCAKVANYAQWRGREEFEAIFENPEAREHMKEAEDLARVEPTLHEVSYTHEAH